MGINIHVVLTSECPEVPAHLSGLPRLITDARIGVPQLVEVEIFQAPLRVSESSCIHWRGFGDYRNHPDVNIQKTVLRIVRYLSVLCKRIQIIMRPSFSISF